MIGRGCESNTSTETLIANFTTIDAYLYSKMANYSRFVIRRKADP